MPAVVRTVLRSEKDIQVVRVFFENLLLGLALTVAEDFIVLALVILMLDDFLCEVFVPIRVWLRTFVLALLVNLVENIDGVFVIIVVRAKPYIRVFRPEVNPLIRVVEA